MKTYAAGAHDERSAIRNLIRSYVRKVKLTGDKTIDTSVAAATEILRRIAVRVHNASKRPGGMGRK
jgi:hypothetical protein